VTIPRDVYSDLKRRIEADADRVGWATTNLADKSRLYDQWVRDPLIGGVLARYLELAQVRVYIKDTLLKDYHRKRSGSAERPFRILGLGAEVEIAHTYIKPHGRRLTDGRVICWGRADNWKLIAMALHERSYGQQGSTPFAALLSEATGRFREAGVREMVEAAATKLGIHRVVWLEE
jgi:hypothetical protein